MRGAMAFAVAAATGFMPCAHGARPMVTDDARIVDAQACQIETWTKRNADSTEYWALPACNPAGNVEITVGGASTTADGMTRTTDEVIQGKTLFRTLDEGVAGIGLAVGMVRHPHREAKAGWPGDPYAYVPLSASFAEGRWVSHVNVGASRRRDEGRTVATWGWGHEVQLRPELFLIPEIFHADPGRPSYQLGLRYWIVKDVVQVDATYGNRLVSDSQPRWFSIGVRILTPPFLR
ncbi:MAG TPA: hypothetical protein VFP36_16015 [Usitatibacter sp.]|nr:hypothetical protein [Usitatibacter sp.]